MLQTKEISCESIDLGLIDYDKAYAIQKVCVQDVIGGGPQKLIFCEHPTVITVGRLARQENILMPAGELNQKGIKVQYVDRGGDITLHAPGQLVIYPIFNLNNHGRDLKIYLHSLEQVMIDLLKDFGIVAHRFPKRTGVWTGEKKIVSMGIGVRKWVSFHGVGLNVNTNLKLFSMMRPCGLDVSMTSMEQQLNRPIDISLVRQKALQFFAKNFYLNLV